MIVDPCNAPLVETTYGNSAPTLRVRTKKVQLNSHTPTSTAGTYAYGAAWHPTLGYFKFRVTSSTTDWYLAATSIFWTPDTANNTASAYVSQPTRAVGGCLSFAWGETELKRKGMISGGIINGGIIWEGLQSQFGGQNAPFTSIDLASQLAVQCRTPNDRCELNWVPTEADAEYRESLLDAVTSSANGAMYGRTNFCVLMITVPQAVDESVAIEIKTLAIIEANLDTPGVVADAAHVGQAGSRTSVSDIVRVLQRRDPSWYVDAFKKVGKLIGQGAKAYMTGGALGLVSELAGMAISSRKNFSA